MSTLPERLVSKNLWRGNPTKHSAATKKKLSAIAKRRHAGMSRADKAALYAKIAESLRGRKSADLGHLQSADVRAKRAESIKRSWSRLTPEQRAERVAKMQAARQPSPPAAMGPEKRVRLFFAAKKGKSHREVAREIGVSRQAVRKHRDPRSILPYQRQLLRSTVNRNGVEEIVKEMVGHKPRCPRCGGKAGVRRDSQRGVWMSKCPKCRKHTTLPPGTRVRKPMVLVDRRRLEAFLLAVAGGREIVAASREAGIARSTGNSITVKILRRWGGYTEADWRTPNPSRSQRPTETVAPTTGASSSR